MEQSRGSRLFLLSVLLSTARPPALAAASSHPVSLRGNNAAVEGRVHHANCDHFAALQARRGAQSAKRWALPALQQMLMGTTPAPSVNWRTFWDFFEPVWTCNDEEEIGPVHDGHKWMCGLDSLRDDLRRPCLVYSYGSAGETSWERAVFERTGQRCDVHVFDPTPGFGSEAEQNAKAKAAFKGSFHYWGLGGVHDDHMELEGFYAPKSEDKTMTDIPVESLTTTLQKLGHSEAFQRTIDILKIDCEGCEWASLGSIALACQRDEVRIGQMQIELHAKEEAVEADTAAHKDAGNTLRSHAAKVLRELEEHCDLRIFHKEPNILGCDGYRCVEYSFVNVREQCRRKLLSGEAGISLADAPECFCRPQDGTEWWWESMD